MKLFDCNTRRIIYNNDTVTRNDINYVVTDINFEEQTAKMRAYGKRMAWLRSKENLEEIGIKFIP